MPPPKPRMAPQNPAPSAAPKTSNVNNSGVMTPVWAYRYAGMATKFLLGYVLSVIASRPNVNLNGVHDEEKSEATVRQKEASEAELIPPQKRGVAQLG